MKIVHTVEDVRKAVQLFVRLMDWLKVLVILISQLMNEKLR